MYDYGEDEEDEEDEECEPEDELLTVEELERFGHDPLASIMTEEDKRQFRRIAKASSGGFELDAYAPNKRQSRLVSSSKRRARPAPVWSVERRIPEHGVGQMYGETYTGKSFVALDLALTIANGLPEWHGARVNVAGPVVYVLMEGVFDFQQRIDAWLAAHPGTTDENLFTLEEEEVDLAAEQSVRQIERDAELLGIEPVLVVIDTQSLATPGTDENSNTDMNLVFGNLKRLSARLGRPVLTVHHTGYDTTRTRGASAQKAALDFQIRIEEGSILFEKVKGYKKSGPFEFHLEPAGDSVWASPGGGPPDPNRTDQQILGAVRERPWTLTKREAIEGVGRSKKNADTITGLILNGDLIVTRVRRLEGSRRYQRDVLAVAGTPLPDPEEA